MKDGQERQNRRMDGFDMRVEALDGRLSTVEQRGPVRGAASGSAMAIGTTLLAEAVRQWFRSGSGGS